MIRLIEQIDARSGSLFSYIGIVTDRSKELFTVRLARLCDALSELYVKVKRTHGSAGVWCCVDRAREVPLRSHIDTLCSSIDATIMERKSSTTGRFERHFVSVSTKQSKDFAPLAADRDQYQQWLINQLLAGWKHGVQQGIHELSHDDLMQFQVWAYKEQPIWRLDHSGGIVVSHEPLPEPETNFVDWSRLVRIHAPERLERTSGHGDG